VDPNQDRREEVEHAYQPNPEAAAPGGLELVLEKYRIARPWSDTFEKYERWHADWALQDYGRAHAGPPPDSAIKPLP
jgi:hypothetical protein